MSFEEELSKELKKPLTFEKKGPKKEVFFKIISCLFRPMLLYCNYIKLGYFLYQELKPCTLALSKLGIPRAFVCPKP